MSVFVDTGVVFAHHDTTAERHDAAVDTFDELLTGSHGQLYTSDYVLDEAVTLTRVRTGSFDAADGIARRILGDDPFPSVFELVHVEPDDVRGALDVLRRYEDHAISFTDATTIHLCDRYDVDGVVSFDSDFDGLVDRVDPGS